MTSPDFASARAHAIELLARLPAELAYHSAWHTSGDVVPAAERLAHSEGVGDDELLLLRTAAYFHDVGYLWRPAEHERAGVRLACEALPTLGYRPADLRAIAAMIMATRLPQQPAGRLAQILADADLDVLGRADFLERNALLREELAARGQRSSDAQWLRGQVGFLAAHRYWTSSARDQRDAGKRANLAALRARLAALG